MTDKPTGAEFDQSNPRTIYLEMNMCDIEKLRDLCNQITSIRIQPFFNNLAEIEISGKGAVMRDMHSSQEEIIKNLRTLKKSADAFRKIMGTKKVKEFESACQVDGLAYLNDNKYLWEENEKRHRSLDKAIYWLQEAGELMAVEASHRKLCLKRADALKKELSNET